MDADLLRLRNAKSAILSRTSLGPRRSAGTLGLPQYQNPKDIRDNPRPVISPKTISVDPRPVSPSATIRDSPAAFAFGALPIERGREVEQPDELSAIALGVLAAELAGERAG